jgi:microcystin-dependent protein
MLQVLARVSLLPYTFAPAGWSFCDGHTLPISENIELYELLRTSFGGDGEMTFAVPDLSAAAPRGCHYCISLFGYPEDGSNGFVGQTLISATRDNPRNMMECAGQSLQAGQYMVLNTYMGARFGGDGRQSFNLPDLRGRVSAGCRYMMFLHGEDPHSTRLDLYVGEIVLLPYEATTPVLRPCDGTVLPIEQNKALFSLLRDRFGGDGKKTFAVPDLRAAAPPKFTYHISLQGVFPGPG